VPRRNRSIAASIALFSLCASPALAGPADPVPLLNGVTKAAHVFTASGVLIDSNTGLAVLCTSLEKSKDIDIAVEVFQFDGTALNDLTLGAGVATSTAPGATRTWEVTNNGGGILYTLANVAVPSVGNVYQGSVRIVATSARIACSAAMMDRTNDPPNFIWPLNLIAKTKQKGV